MSPMRQVSGARYAYLAMTPRARLPASFFIETLGCPKNAVDSDKVAASLLADGLQAAGSAGEADLVVVNTCAFVEAARAESIETVLALADARRPGARLVVTGCLAERHGAELAAALPEVDAVVGFAGEGSISEVVLRRPPKGGPRDLLELPRPAPSAPWAYVKVAEGCDRTCAFCAIPSFRGKQRSRRPEAIEAEARALVAGGARELVLVAQDLAWYGRDAGESGALTPLLRRLDRLAADGLLRLRLLYLYPSQVRDPLVSTMLELPTVVPYFDLSLQHAAPGLLRRMQRWGSGERFAAIIEGIRAQQPARRLPLFVHRRVPGGDGRGPRGAHRFPGGRRARLGRLLPLLGRGGDACGHHGRGGPGRRGGRAAVRAGGDAGPDHPVRT